MTSTHVWQIHVHSQSKVIWELPILERTLEVNAHCLFTHSGEELIHLASHILPISCPWSNSNKARSVIVINFFSCKKSHFRKLKKKKKPWWKFKNTLFHVSESTEVSWPLGTEHLGLWLLSTWFSWLCLLHVTSALGWLLTEARKVFVHIHRERGNNIRRTMKCIFPLNFSRLLQFICWHLTHKSRDSMPDTNKITLTFLNQTQIPGVLIIRTDSL